MSDARGWRCPTGAGSGLVRTAPGLGGAGLSSGGFCAQAVPAMAVAKAANAAALGIVAGSGPSISGTGMTRPGSSTGAVGGSTKVSAGAIGGNGVHLKHP